MKTLRSAATFLLQRLTLAAAGTAAALTVFLILGHEVNEDGTIRFDATVLHYFQGHQSRLIHGLMAAISLLASGWAITVISAACIYVLWRKPELRREAISLLIVGAGGQAVVYGLKEIFHRARPEAIFAHLGYSFPSGHAFAAVGLYGMFAYWLGRSASLNRRVAIWLGAALLILLIGFSRIYLCVHYASDVLAGFAAGLPWLWGCLALPSRRREAPGGKRNETL